MGRLVQKETAGVSLIGYSVAGEESVVAAPGYDVCFDIGRAPREVIPIDNVCITHGHMDHAAGVAYYLSQRDFVGCAPGRVIVHRRLAQPIQRLMEVWSDIEGHPAPGRIYGVEHLEDAELRRGLHVRAFSVNHPGNALGFTLIETRHKLKPEFQGKTGPELVALKRQGVAIEYTLEIPLLTYTGDTAPGRFLDHGFVAESRLVLLECTFFAKEHLARAREGRHCHVEDLPKMLAAIPQAEVLLTHVSRRTDLRSAKQMLRRTIDRSEWDRVGFFMERPPVIRTPRGNRAESTTASPREQEV